MKVIRNIFFIFSLAAISRSSLDGMKRDFTIDDQTVQQDASKHIKVERVISLAWLDSDEHIEISEKIAKHSSHLEAMLNQSCDTSVLLQTKFSQKTIHAIHDCLKIIDSGNDVENLLIARIHEYVLGNKLQNLVNAGHWLGIQQFLDALGPFKVYVYNQRLNAVIQKAKAYFDKIENKEQCAIVIDVDDTALYRHNCQAIQQVKNLYDFVVSAGFKIFFLTTRPDKSSLDQSVLDGYEKTVKDLENAGYDTYEQVICIPRDKFVELQAQAREDAKLFIDKYKDDLNAKNQEPDVLSSSLFVDSLGQWKKAERIKIAQEFTIAGTLDDVPENLLGEDDCLGLRVLIPRLR